MGAVASNGDSGIGAAGQRHHPDADPPHRPETKAELRSRVLAARRELRPDYRAAAGRALREHALACPEITGARVVGVYVSVGTEPDTRQLLESLAERGTRVLLPLLLADMDLDWACYDGTASLGAADRGLLEPATPPLGPEAIREADALILPALALDRRGFRLGRGGGSYDRVLARLDLRTFTVGLLYAGEIVDAVPAEPHDRRVAAALTPSGLVRFG